MSPSVAWALPGTKGKDIPRGHMQAPHLAGTTEYTDTTCGVALSGTVSS